MRMLIVTLLAGAALASPLAAQDRQDRPDRGEHPGHDHGERGGRPQQQQAQQQQAQQPQAQQQPQQAQQQQRSQQRSQQQPQQSTAPQPQRAPEGARPQGDGRRFGGGQNGAPSGAGAAQRDQGYRGDPRGDRGPGVVQRDGQRTEAYRADPRAGRSPDGQQRDPRDRGYARDGQQRDYGYRADPRQGAPGGLGQNRGGDYRGGQYGGGQWSRDWRSDRRFDWQGRREADRGRFHAPRYAPPRGYDYGYRRWSVGIRLAPLFFDSGYWLGDADYYGLPPAYGPYRWVRYYDDILLVDVRTGYVADAIYGFFW